MNEQMEAKNDGENWQIDTSFLPADDSLLSCLLLLAQINQRPISPKALTAGLPNSDDGLMTPDIFIRAAKRVGLSAQLIKRPFKKLASFLFPAVLLLNDQQACIILEVGSNKTAKVIYPDAGMGVTEISLAELEKQYMGHAIFTKTLFSFDKRVDEVIAKPKK